MGEFDIQEMDGGVVFGLKVIPGASKDSIAGLMGGLLKVKVATVARQGKANRQVIRFIADKLKVKKRQVEIDSGLRSHKKRLRVSGVSARYVMDRFNLKQEDSS